MHTAFAATLTVISIWVTSTLCRSRYEYTQVMLSGTAALLSVELGFTVYTVSQLLQNTCLQILHALTHAGISMLQESTQ